MAEASALRDAEGAFDPTALAVVLEDATVFFLPMMMEFLGAVAMAIREQGGR
jgi:hypothetical protein